MCADQRAIVLPSPPHAPGTASPEGGKGDENKTHRETTGPRNPAKRPLVRVHGHKRPSHQIRRGHPPPAARQAQVALRQVPHVEAGHHHRRRRRHCCLLGGGPGGPRGLGGQGAGGGRPPLPGEPWDQSGQGSWPGVALPLEAGRRNTTTPASARSTVYTPTGFNVHQHASQLMDQGPAHTHSTVTVTHTDTHFGVVVNQHIINP